MDGFSSFDTAQSGARASGLQTFRPADARSVASSASSASAFRPLSTQPLPGSASHVSMQCSVPPTYPLTERRMMDQTETLSDICMLLTNISADRQRMFQNWRPQDGQRMSESAYYLLRAQVNVDVRELGAAIARLQATTDAIVNEFEGLTSSTSLRSTNVPSYRP